MNRESASDASFWSLFVQPVVGAVTGGVLGVAHPGVTLSSLAGGTILSSLPKFVHIDAFMALGCLIGLDMILGTAKALWVDRSGFSSSRFAKGAVKSLFVFLVPLSLWLVATIDHQLEPALNWLCTGSIVWFGCWEVLSILRNAGRCGLPIPKVWMTLLDGTMSQAGKEPDNQDERIQSPIRRQRSRAEDQAVSKAQAKEPEGQD